MASREYVTGLIKSLGPMYGADIRLESLRVYAAALVDIPDEEVGRAVSEHLRDPERGRRMPLPADIIAKTGRGKNAHLGADEAWAVALESFDEAASVMWTAEIEAARNAALRIWQDGDHTGARMAFRAAYEREMRNPKPINWKLSAGHDPVRRVEAVRKAHEAGLISEARAKLLLPGNQAQPQGVAGLLPGPDDDPKTNAREWIDYIKRILAEPAKIKRSQVNIDSGAWTEEMEERFEANMELLGLNAPLRIPYVQPGSARACAYPNCASPGTLSASTTGGSSWYCAGHFKA